MVIIELSTNIKDLMYYLMDMGYTYDDERAIILEELISVAFEYADRGDIKWFKNLYQLIGKLTPDKEEEVYMDAELHRHISSAVIDILGVISEIDVPIGSKSKHIVVNDVVGNYAFIG